MTAWPFALLLLMAWGLVCVLLHLLAHAGLLRGLRSAVIGMALWSVPVGALALRESIKGAMGWEPLLLLLLLGLYTLAYFRTPKRLLGQPLSPLDAPELEKGLRELARAQGLHRLELRALGTGASLGAHAWAANIASPTVIIAGGVLHRLSLPQQLALGAHELGHHSSGSLWWMMGGLPLGLSIGLAAGLWLPTGSALGLGVVLAVLLSRMWLSRPTELHCDALAARATSAQDMAQGLRRLHALHPVELETPMGTAAYALATHPPLPLRLEALGQAHPMAQRHRRAAWIAQSLLVLLVLLAALTQQHFLFFVFLSVLPKALLSLAARSTLKRSAKRMPMGWEPRLLWLSIGGVLTVAVPVLSGVFGDRNLLPWLPLLLLFEVLAVVLLFRRYRRRKLTKRVHLPLQAGMLQDVWDLWDSEGVALDKNPALAHDVLAVGYALDKPGASQAMLELAPRFPQAALSLSALSYARDPELSLQAARAFSAMLPQDFAGPMAQGRAYLSAGELEPAQAQLERARALQAAPELEILQAAIALARGQLAIAAQALERAEQALPGDPWLGVVRAELLLESGERAAALAELERARGVVKALPIHGHGVVLDALSTKLQATPAPADASARE